MPDFKKVFFKEKKIIRLFIIVFFVVVLIIGLAVYDDYGISFDEPIQRQHSLINYEYINEKVFGREISYIKNLNLPSLEGYTFNFYNMAMQVPLVFIENLNHFAMSTRDIFLMRHLFTFLIYFCALICFFFLCRDLFKKEWLALAGTAMLFLFPRFFAQSFYNIKDMVFIALFIIALFLMIKLLIKKRRILWCVLFAVALAFSTNTRFIGAVLLPVLFVAMILEDVAGPFFKNRELAEDISAYNGKFSLTKRMLPYILVPAVFIATYIFITPASWNDPLHYIKSTFTEFSDYSYWDGTMVFAGNLVTSAERPWYYIPVWMGITIPVFYIAMFFPGAVILVKNTLKKRFAGFFKDRYVWLAFFLFLIPLLALIATHTTIYLGWRHVFFLFVPFVLIAAYGVGGLQDIFSNMKLKFGKWILPVVTIAALAVGAGRIIVNHPYQFDMFNAIGIPMASQFDRDYWSLTGVDMTKYILTNYEGDVKIHFRTNDILEMLSPGEKGRIKMIGWDQKDDADFILNDFRNKTGNEFEVPGFTEIYSIWQDGYKIAQILKNDNFNPS